MPRTKKGNIVVLQFTDEELDERKRLKEAKKIEVPISESEIEEEHDKLPKRLIGNIIDKGIKIVRKDERAATLNYEDYEIHVIKVKGEYWYRGKHLAIILQYTNTKGALTRHVDEENKKRYGQLGVGKRSDRIKPQTVYIDDTGFFNLVSKSKKPEAKKFWRKITKEILPNLFRTGTYTLPITENDIERLNKSFYDDNMLSDYDQQNVFYLAYIGQHKVKVNGKSKVEHVLKPGITGTMSRRELEEHRKFYEVFNVIGIWKTLANVEVENKVRNNLKTMGMLINHKIKGKNNKEENRREHFILNEVHGLDFCINMIEDIVNKTTLPQQDEYLRKIKDQEAEIAKNKLEIEYNQKLMKAKDNEINAKNDQIQMLKEKVQDIQGKLKKSKKTKNAKSSTSSKTTKKK